MKVPCNVIRDLLPLYSDGVCSEESRELVQAHLRSCESCRNEMKIAEEAYEDRVPRPDDEKMAAALSRGWKNAKKRYLYSVVTAIILVIAVICAGICARQTAFLISNQDAFAAAHPDYVCHSLRLLALLLAPGLIACAQIVVLWKNGITPGSQVLYCILSAGMIVLEVLALRSAAGQHYHMGMLISDYGLQAPFDGGWMLLILVLVLTIVSVIQLLTVVFSALAKLDGRIE